MNDYAHQLSELMHNASLRNEIQQNIIPKSNDYSIETIVKQWDELFKTIL